VVFITGYREELEARKPDATVLEKPIKPDELAEAVRKVLGDKAQRLGHA